MDEKPEEKPFSVLERFRQLKKEKEHLPTETVAKSQESVNTVFQASTSTINSPNGSFGRMDGFQRNRGRNKKRNFEDNLTERPNKKLSPAVYQGQKEPDVGITEFIRDGPGFDIILKHRFTDFQVNEIDLEGNVVKLTSTEIPKQDQGSEKLSEEEDPTLLSPEQWASVKETVEKNLKSTVGIDVTNMDKDHRQRIHKAVKRRFGVHVFSQTKDVEGRKLIQIGWGCAQSNLRFCQWPRGRPEYLHFVLFKENCEMSEAINVISRLTNIKAGKFGYAGMKDKRAVTTQQMCVRRGDVLKFGKCSNLRGITVGNYNYKWSNIRLGDLKGNRFRIALRHVKASDEVVKDAVEKLKETGFINYFGLQRFGQSVSVPTPSIGKAILKSDWKLAVELILKPRPTEVGYRDVEGARETWWRNHDASEALKLLSRKDRSIEGKILQGLKKHGPNAYQNAFDNLPRHLVTMYVHSYQSLIWNNVVSRRIRECGLRVLPGDLVELESDEGNKTEAAESSDDEDDIKPADPMGGGRIHVRALSADEAATASIFDVYYPLPGDDVRFPNNQTAQWYTEMMEKDGHSLQCFKNMNKKYGMYGSYRLMMARTEDLSWETVRYSDPDEDLFVSDLDLLKGKPPIVPDPEGPYKALVLEFNLKVCCYATMAVRELTKCNTSTKSQAELTALAREEDQANKQLKQERITETSEKEPNGTLEESMETDNESPQRPEDSLEEENKREAEADNFINKYLENNYH